MYDLGYYIWLPPVLWIYLLLNPCILFVQSQADFLWLKPHIFKKSIFKTHYCNAPTLIGLMFWAYCKQNDQHFTYQENIYLNFEGLLLDTCWHDVFKKQNKLSLHLNIRGLFVGEVSLGTLKSYIYNHNIKDYVHDLPWTAIYFCCGWIYFACVSCTIVT